jgi:hypothetical protein
MTLLGARRRPRVNTMAFWACDRWAGTVDRAIGRTSALGDRPAVAGGRPSYEGRFSG